MNRNSLRFVLAVLWLWLGPSAWTQAQTPPSATGHWEGSIQLEGMKLGLGVDLAQQADGAWQGTITIPAQQFKESPLKNVSFKDGIVAFDVPNVPGNPSFKGKLAEDGQAIAGELTQSGRTLPFQLARRATKAEAPLRETHGPTPDKGVPGQSVEGHWQGTLDVGGNPLRLILKVRKAPEAAFTAQLDSPDQGVAELAIDSITFKDKMLRFELKRLGAVYEGKLNQTGSEIAGEWQQGGAALPLSLKRLDGKREH